MLPHLHKLASTRPYGNGSQPRSDSREPYLSVQLNYLERLSSIKLHIDSRNDSECSSWVISD
eukprot:1673727-Amphidinium_carterae.1